MNTIFTEIGVVVAAATFCALAVRLLKQPPILGYIIAGVILGPIGAHFIQNQNLFEGIRQIGIALLLFLVGLELDWSKTKHQLATTFLIGSAQVSGSFLAGYLLSTVLGLPVLTGIYLGAALSFSSTVIVIKILSESRDMNSLHGRLSVGLLLFQDVAAIIVMIVLGGVGSPSSLGTGSLLLLLLLKSLALLAILYFLSQYVLPRLFRRIARSGELLFLASLAWCFVVAIAGSYYDFPVEIGAFLAGVSLAALPYSLDILSRLRSLRDFFVILLFVSFGTELSIPGPSIYALIGGMMVITVIVKPLMTFITLHLRGFRNRTAFLTSLSLGQMSEFSLILVSIGLAQGQISSDIATGIVFTTIASIFVSTILLNNRERLYNLVRKPLRHIEHNGREHLYLAEEKELENHIIIFGYHRMGYHILSKLRALHHRVLVVDFNPDIIRRLKEQGVDCLYGDVQDEDILELIQADKASMIISTIPHSQETTFLINEVKAHHKKPILIVTSHHIDDALEYYKLGANYVILPHLLGGEHVADLISEYEHHELRGFIKQQAEELKLLKAKNHALYYD
ncbi:MAG: cation:proton antiporter [bacterium]